MNYLVFILLIMAPFTTKAMQAIEDQSSPQTVLTFEQRSLLEKSIGVILQNDNPRFSHVLMHKERIFSYAQAIIARGTAATTPEISRAKATLMLINFAGINKLEIARVAQDLYLELEQLNERISRTFN